MWKKWSRQCRFRTARDALPRISKMHRVAKFDQISTLVGDWQIFADVIQMCGFECEICARNIPGCTI